MEHCKRELADWTLSRLQTPQKDLPVPPSSLKMDISTALDHTGRGKVVVADASQGLDLGASTGRVGGAGSSHCEACAYPRGSERRCCR